MNQCNLDGEMRSVPSNKHNYFIEIKYEPSTFAKNEEIHAPTSFLPNTPVSNNYGQWTDMSSSLTNQDDNDIDIEYEQNTCKEIQCTNDWKGHQPESLLSPTPQSNEQYCDEQQNTAKSNKQKHVIQIKYEPNRFMKIQASKNKKRQQLEKLLLPKTCKENTDDASSSSQSQNNKVSACLRKYLDGIETGKRRMQIKSPSSLLECGYVSYYTDDYQSKEQTAIKHTGEKFYKCDKCSKSCKTKAHLKRHYKKHQKRKIYFCDLCSFICVNASALTVHKREHTREKIQTYKCNFCCYCSYNSKRVENHIRNMHNGGEPYKCDICVYSTVHLGEFEKHKKQHKDKKPYKCDVCHYSASRPEALERHKTQHTDKKPYKCNECDFATIYPSALKQHEIIHKEEKPYRCDLCNYRTKWCHHLKTHMLIHTGEKPHTCDLCDYSTSYPPNLRRHRMKHTGEKPYKCDVCPYRSIKFEGLRQHTLTHRGEKPYKCDLCDYTSTRNSSVKRHKMIVHMGSNG